MANKYLQLFPVPEGFPEILSDFAREVLRDQPEDIIEYAALYFETLQQGKPWDYDSKFNVKSTSKKHSYQAQGKSVFKIGNSSNKTLLLKHDKYEHQHHSTHHKESHQHDAHHHHHEVQQHHVKENYTKEHHTKAHEKEHQKEQNQSLGRTSSQHDVKSVHSDSTHKSDKIMAKNYMKDLEEETLMKEYQQRPASSDGMRSPIGSEVSHKEDKMLARTYLMNLEKEAFEEAAILNSPTAMGAAAQGRKLKQSSQESLEYKSESEKSDKINASGDRPISHKSDKRVATNYVHQLADDVIREVSPEHH